MLDAGFELMQHFCLICLHIVYVVVATLHDTEMITLLYVGWVIIYGHGTIYRLVVLGSQILYAKFPFESQVCCFIFRPKDLEKF